MSNKYLIVEGLYDKIFYKALFEKINLKKINVKSPQDFSIPYDGKGNCINLLSDLVPQFNDGTIEKIALIVDSDFNEISAQGFSNTLRNIDQKLSSLGYNKSTQSCNHKDGIIYSNPRGLPPIAVWIMPDNQNEGYLEYFLKKAIHQDNIQILEESIEICNKMKTRKFSDHHLVKSQLAVFMAMQDNPGRNINHMLERSLIDLDSTDMKKLCKFLKDYYS